MANGILEATVVGTLVRDPERKDWNGQAYCVYSVAVNTFSRGANEVTYIEGSLWGKQVDSFMKSAHKGNTIFVSGSLKLKEYEWNGTKRSKLQLSANTFRVFGGQSAPQTQPGFAPPQVQNQPQGQQEQPQTDNGDLPF